MFGTAILVFREVLEAALIIGLVAAATKGLPHRGKWIGVGVLFGISGAVLLSLLADVVAQAAEGLGQELLNAIILFSAVLMLGWHNIWMKKHSRELTRYVKGVGADVSSGETPLHVLAIVVGLAVLREGAELVLFLYGLGVMGTQVSQIMLGSLMGLAAGAAIGGILYFGLTHIPTRLIFSVTSIMLLLLSAGLAAQGAAMLVQADVLPAYGHAIWDTSWLLSDRSIAGNIFHVLIGYVSAPMGIQVIFYLGTLLVIGGLMFFVNRPRFDSPALKASA
jgi:high-affinity iron transporter